MLGGGLQPNSPALLLPLSCPIVLLVMEIETLQNEWYVVIQACKFPFSRFFGIISRSLSVLCVRAIPMLWSLPAFLGKDLSYHQHVRKHNGKLQMNYIHVHVIDNS